jgi:hypothetical protein
MPKVTVCEVKERGANILMRSAPWVTVLLRRNQSRIDNLPEVKISKNSRKDEQLKFRTSKQRRIAYERLPEFLYVSINISLESTNTHPVHHSLTRVGREEEEEEEEEAF